MEVISQHSYLRSPGLGKDSAYKRHVVGTELGSGSNLAVCTILQRGSLVVPLASVPEKLTGTSSTEKKFIKTQSIPLYRQLYASISIFLSNENTCLGSNFV